jgi:predicted AAA+ superfamily ATPase
LLGQGQNESSPAYLNWDVLADRENILAERLPPGQSRIIFDEIHKYAQWRNLMKGLFDKNKTSISFIVTGSARLDYYRKGGDSLQGRYHYYRLHPFTVMDCKHVLNDVLVEQLLRFGGFPEPFFKGEERFHRRWMREHSSRVIYEDLRDLENVREVSMLDLLLSHLPACVGSPLSVNSLSKLLQVAYETVEHWLVIFERLYMCYRIPPFGAKRIRAVRKEKKLYFWDWSRVEDPGARFENMVAGHLLKYCHYIEDTEGYEMELRFIRDTDKREVDFVVLCDGQAKFAVECKSGERSASPACRYFRERTDIPQFYQVHMGTKDFGNATTHTRVLPFSTFCREMGLP